MVNNFKGMKGVSYFELGQRGTDSHLPYVKLECVIVFVRHKFRRMMAAVFFDGERTIYWETCAYLLTERAFRREFYCNLKICKIDSRTG